ncbi:MAG: EscU/YscU/HrcU family type III secretion system export apparatus switch protein [Rhodanobacteraceae bacterium]
MSDDTDDQGKTEPATARRIEKAREEGQVARSRELVTLALLGGGLIGLWMLGGHLSRRLGMVMEQALLFDRRQAFDSRAMLSRVFEFGSSALSTLAPLLLALVTLLATLNGYAPQLALEFGRKVLNSADRPSFDELEAHVRGTRQAANESP